MRDQAFAWDESRTENCSCVSSISTLHGGHDAVLLKRGGKLLVHAEGEPALTTASIVDVQLETTTIAAFNLEVANAHTFIVGEDGFVVKAR